MCVRAVRPSVRSDLSCSWFVKKNSVADPNATCSNGLAGIEDADGTVCCDAACGQCGGDGCGDVAGFSDADCCSATIEGSGELCSIALAAPCKVDPPGAYRNYS